MQTEMFDPPRQRVRLVEEGPREVVAEVTDLTGIRVFPAEVVDLTGHPASLLTEWFDAEQSVPTTQGFYQVGFGEGPRTAWFDGRAFFMAGGKACVPGMQRFVWRGALEILGRRRRTLLD